MKTTQEQREEVRKWTSRQRFLRAGGEIPTRVMLLLDDLDEAIARAKERAEANVALRAELAQERERAARVDAAYCSLRAELARVERERDATREHMHDVQAQASRLRAELERKDAALRECRKYARAPEYVERIVDDALAPAATKSEPEPRKIAADYCALCWEPVDIDSGQYNIICLACDERPGAPRPEPRAEAGDECERVAQEFLEWQYAHGLTGYSSNTERRLAALLREFSERGWNEAVEACAKAFLEGEGWIFGGPRGWLCLDHGGDEQERIVTRIRCFKRPPRDPGEKR